MSDKIGKKLFKLLSDLLSFIQITLIFLSLFTIFYWIFQIAGLKFIEPVAPLFESIKETTHIFYQRTVNFGDAVVDFSFLVAALFMIFCSWLINFIIEYIELTEKKYDKLTLKIKKKKEEAFNAQLEKEYLMESNKNNKFLVLIKINPTNMTKDKFYNRNLDEGVKEKEKEVLFNLLEIIDEDFNCKKNIIENSVLLVFNDFNVIDKVLQSIESILAEIKNKYLEEKWGIEYSVSIDVFENETEIDSKIIKLNKLIKLGLINEIVCLSSFNEKYSSMRFRKYSLTSEGSYQMGEGNEEVFCMKSSK